MAYFPSLHPLVQREITPFHPVPKQKLQRIAQKWIEKNFIKDRFSVQKFDNCATSRPNGSFILIGQKTSTKLYNFVTRQILGEYPIPDQSFIGVTKEGTPFYSSDNGLTINTGSSLIPLFKECNYELYNHPSTDALLRAIQHHGSQIVDPLNLNYDDLQAGSYSSHCNDNFLTLVAGTWDTSVYQELESGDERPVRIFVLDILLKISKLFYLPTQENLHVSTSVLHGNTLFFSLHNLHETVWGTTQINPQLIELNILTGEFKQIVYKPGEGEITHILTSKDSIYYSINISTSSNSIFCLDRSTLREKRIHDCKGEVTINFFFFESYFCLLTADAHLHWNFSTLYVYDPKLSRMVKRKHYPSHNLKIYAEDSRLLFIEKTGRGNPHLVIHDYLNPTPTTRETHVQH